jgi:hypothetical protein
MIGPQSVAEEMTIDDGFGDDGGFGDDDDSFDEEYSQLFILLTVVLT